MTIIRINSRSIKAGIAYCFQASDDSSRRYALAGIHMEFDSEGNCEIIATDGRRMHVATIPKCQFHTSTPNIAFTLDRDSTKVLCDMSVSGILQIEVHDGLADVVTIYAPKGRKGESITEHKQVESKGRFPNWRQVIPEHRHEHGTVRGHVSEFLTMIESAQAIPTFVYFDDANQPYFKLSQESGSQMSVLHPENLKGPLALNLEYLKQAVSHISPNANCIVREYVMLGRAPMYRVEVANTFAIIMGLNSQFEG